MGGSLTSPSSYLRHPSSPHVVSSSQSVQGSAPCALTRWIMAQCDDSNCPPTEDSETNTIAMTAPPLQVDFEPISVTSCCTQSSTSLHSSCSAVSCDSSDTGYTSSDCSLEQGSIQVRFRKDQAEQWSDRYDELVDFFKNHGHCRVPRNRKRFAPLASWVKRQRYQYKLRQEGKPSFLTDERVAVLDKLGFVWDSHNSVWDQRFEELRIFAQRYGHVNVPYNFSNAQLASWVKAQRREFKGFRNGTKKGKSQILMQRFSLLESLDFSWELRSSVSPAHLDNSSTNLAHDQRRNTALLLPPSLR
jgi:hypothetical protein